MTIEFQNLLNDEFCIYPDAFKLDRQNENSIKFTYEEDLINKIKFYLEIINKSNDGTLK